MRKYDDSDERKIRSERLVREWTRSGLLSKVQRDRILPDLKVGVRRTNLFLRLILFGFGILIIAASVVLVGQVLGIRDEGAIAMLCLFAAVVCFVLAELLAGRFGLYRFGVEEAAAAGGVALLAIAGAVFTSSMHTPRSGPAIAGLMLGSIGAFAVYRRFGYLYAALGSMLCISLAVFQIPLAESMQRLLSAGLLASVFFVARSKRRKWAEEFPGDEYGIIQAIAWAGVYASLNLQLFPLGLLSQRVFPIASMLHFFYWFTYAAIWIFPPIGLYFALRDKDRPLLDVSLVLAIVTLITNKPYLGSTRQTWDPIVFGALLIATALLLRRWLSRGERNGYTAVRLLSSDKRRLSVVGTASAALHVLPHAPASASTDTFQPGGGRSGGAGASGSF